MIQNIIVALIVAVAVVYAGYAVYRSVRPGNKPRSACGGCTGCELKNMKDSCSETTSKSFVGKSIQPYPTRKIRIS